jgi:hypothetical protein
MPASPLSRSACLTAICVLFEKASGRLFLPEANGGAPDQKRGRIAYKTGHYHGSGDTVRRQLIPYRIMDSWINGFTELMVTGADSLFATTAVLSQQNEKLLAVLTDVDRKKKNRKHCLGSLPLRQAAAQLSRA